jgi:hypothetical protein
LNPNTIRDEFRALIDARDVQGFMELAQAAKAQAIDLIHQDLQLDASNLLNQYGRVFVNIDVEDPDFILAILPLFPKNDDGTLRYLGQRTDLDQAILASKVDVDAMTNSDAFCKLINWAIGKEDWALVERVVLHIAHYVKEHHPNNALAQREVANGILMAFVHEKDDVPVYPSSIDDAIASIVNHTADWRLQDYYFDRLARMGMPKTLMKMLEHGRIAAFNCAPTAANQHILDCIPEQLTPKQLHAVHNFLNVKGIKQRILFDESTDLEQYIQALMDSNYRNYREHDLRFSCIDSFSTLFTTENIAIPQRRMRIARLINAVVEEVQSKGGTPEGIRGSLVKCGVPAHAMKLVNLFKGEELENELGL